MMNQRKVVEYYAYRGAIATRDKLLPMPKKEDLVWPEDGDPTLDSNCLQVLSWLMANLYCRQFKQRQLYLWGPPNYGKTSMIRCLEKVMMIYRAPMDENFFDAYDEETHQLVVFDEFKGQHPLTFMNLFLQGDSMTLRKKGSQYLKKLNLPVIILSNYSPREAYSKVDDFKLDTFLVRLEVIELVAPVFALCEFLTQVIEC